MNDDFEIGDVVRLKCGSCSMVINYIPTSIHRVADCVWMDLQNKPMSERYRINALIKCRDNE